MAIPISAPLLRELPAVTPLTRDVFDSATAERRLCDYFAVATMDGLSAMSRLEATAAAAAVTYIDRTQVGKRPPLSPPSREAAGTTMAIDPATRANLELTRTLAGERRGSLLDAIDCTVTAGRIAAAGAAACGAADRQRRDRAAARCDRHFRRRQRRARRHPHRAALSARHVARAGAAVGRTRRPARSRRSARRHSGGGRGAGAARRSSKRSAAGDRRRSWRRCAARPAISRANSSARWPSNCR